MKRDLYNSFEARGQNIKVANYLLDMGMINEAVEIAERVATISMNRYTGVYSDGNLESILVRLGKCCNDTTVKFKRKNDKKKLSLHIITSTYEVGGHTRFLKEWIQRDKDHEHFIVVVNQNNVSDNFFPECTLLHIGMEGSVLDKAAILRAIAKQADFIFLHHHPNDIVSVIALATTDIIAPVAVLNHADHLFWVGSSICDFLIEIREGYFDFDINRRHIKRGGYLPIPVSPMQKLSKLECRLQLNISEDAVVLLTMASVYKLKPIGIHNYFEDIIPVLNANKKALLLVIGINETSSLAKKHSQINYLGIVPDPGLYKVACDIYVESFPFASFTSLLETAINGCAIQLMYKPPLLSCMLFSNENDSGIWNYPKSKLEWMENLTVLIKDENYRRIKKEYTAQFINKHHHDEWSGYLRVIYDQLNGLKHTVFSIGPPQLIFTENEIVLSELLINAADYSNMYKIPIIPWQRRLRLAFRWLIKLNSLKLTDISFLFFFVVGKKIKYQIKFT